MYLHTGMHDIVLCPNFLWDKFVTNATIHWHIIIYDFILGNEEKTIIVSQFTKLLSIIQPLLDEEKYTYTRLDGSMNTRERNAVIADFQDSSPDSPRILLLSLRAGIQIYYNRYIQG